MVFGGKTEQQKTLMLDKGGNAMLTIDTIKQITREELIKLIMENNSTGTREDGKNDAMAAIKKRISEGDYRAVSRTIIYYGDGYGYGVHAVLKAMVRLAQFQYVQLNYPPMFGNHTKVN